MAVYYDFGAGFESEESLLTFKAFFEGKTIPLSDGSEVHLQIGENERPWAWILSIWPKGMSIASPHGDRKELLKPPFCDEIRDFFYKELLDAPPFLYAWFGGEAVDFILNDPIEKEITPDWMPADMVFQEDFWKKLRHPEKLTEFKPGYLWVCKSPKAYYGLNLLFF